MLIALLSDVHGNRPAFEAVLDDVDSEGADEIWCLGDLVGYGAQPDDCVALARERCNMSLAGNHDLVVTGEIPISDFSPSAAAAARWTQRDDRRGHDGVSQGSRACGSEARAGALPRAARATRSGSTCSRAGRRRSAWT